MQNTKTEYGNSERIPVVLPEMEQLLPPLSGEQFSVLENNILENGCYAPVIVNGDMEVIDGHYIRECVLDEVVLEDLRRVTAMAREHTREFAEYIGGKQSSEIQREIRRQERELTAMRKRGAELDVIFKKLYEDRVLGYLSVEQFQAQSGGYTAEQEKLAAEIPAKESTIQKLRDTVSSTDGFIAKASGTRILLS